ncbi:MAG: penicillin acylase family protein [Rhodospirillales bacterium]
MRRLLRWTGRIAAGLIAFVALVLATGYLWLRTSLPQTDGDVGVAGLDGRVEITRDSNAVPHVRATTMADAYFGLGYVHAQDRLWQMEGMRRLVAGRLAEIAGPPALRSDRFMRLLGLQALAAAGFAALSPETQAALEAYARGVNAYIAGHRGAWPPEFYAARIAPEPWRPADSLVWGRLMALRLTGNWMTEVLRARLADRLTPAQLDDLWPDDQDGAPATTSAALDPAVARLMQATIDAVPLTLRQTSASNAWAVDGRRSATGKPILANDPHLGFSAPGIWYLARLTAPGLEVSGATAPGVPFTILGHNERIAWGLTTTESDTQDLYLERLVPDRPGHYETPEGPRPFAERTEIIKVRGADDVEMTVRSTRHGPVVSDLDPAAAPAGQVVALAWTGLRADDTTAEAAFRLNRARDWDGALDALRRWHAPQQNLFYADIDGNIGFIAPGLVPVRRSGRGLVPVPGWDDAYGWSGFIPFEELPQSFRPASGRIVNANHRIVGPDYPYWLGNGWSEPYRAKRIFDRLDAVPRQTVETAAALQNDVISLDVADLMPVLLAAGPFEGRAGAAVALLRRWDGAMDRDRPEPLIYTAWLRALNRALYADELGPQFADYWSLRPLVVRRMLGNRTAWCDDIATPGAETCPAQVRAALGQALDELARAHGDDIAGWRWGDAHVARFRHGLFGWVPVLRDLADIVIETDGGAHTVNRAQPRISSEATPYADVHGPGLRAVYDLADLAGSRFMIATGQSGNPLSAHYRDTTERWRDGGYFRLGEGGAWDTLVLTPASAP